MGDVTLNARPSSIPALPPPQSDFIPIFLRNAADALEQRVNEVSAVSINVSE